MKTKRPISLVAATAALSFAMLGMLSPGTVSAATYTPLWVKHVESYPGGVSNGVRAYNDPALNRVTPSVSSSPSVGPEAIQSGDNRQMNNDSNPPMPQNETSVAYSTDHQLTAVAAANDYVSAAVVVMRSADGGQTWKSTRVTPMFAPKSETCSGGDPSVAYSQRDHAFYLAQLCFFRTQDYSEVQVYKSVDDGKTWTPGRNAAVVASNYDWISDSPDASIFNDKEYIAVDNNPGSPHYGRLYVTYTKYHFKPSGFSDYCPIELAYTDNIPTSDPSLAIFKHVKVERDNPNGGGTGASATQMSVPVVEADGTLDIAYVQENCNTNVDRKLIFQKSLDGGKTLLPHRIRVDMAGEWEDNTSHADLLPNKNFRAPNTISLAYSATTGTLAYAYTNYIDAHTSGANVAVSLSHDGGLTWSDSQLVSTKADGVTPAPQDQFFPWVAADPSGNFWMIWFDCRRDSNNHMIDTFEAMSSDDGVTWPNMRISTESWNPDEGFFYGGQFIGDYNGIAASAAAIYPVWTDGRNSAVNQTGIGETDIFTDVEVRP